MSKPMLAAAKLGVLVGCQNWRQADAELPHCLALADPKLMLYSERLAPALGRLDLRRSVRRLALGDGYEQALALADACRAAGGRRRRKTA